MEIQRYTAARHDLAKALLNRVITAVTIEEEGYRLRFTLTDGEVVLVAVGDCCSTSWVESIDDPTALLGTITAVEEIEMPDLGSPDKYDYIQYYGLKITTTQGRAVIDYRNSSNGYYGGDLEVEIDTRTP